MFRVLSEEEAAQVELWRAPDLETGNKAPARDKLTGASQQGLRLVRSTEAGLIESTVADASGTEAGRLQPPADAVAEATAMAEAQAAPQSESPADPNVELLQNAYDEGFAAGQLKAETDARDNSQQSPLVAQAEQDLEAIAGILRALSRQHERIDEAVENELIELAAAMAKLILHRESAQDPEVLAGIVKTAVAQLPTVLQAPSIHLNPLDAEVLRPLLDESEAAGIVENTQLNRGACEIHAGPSLLEAGIDQMVDAISSRWSRSCEDSEAQQRSDTAPPGESVAEV